MLGFSLKYCLLLHTPNTCFSPCADTVRLNYRLVKGADLNLETTLKKERGGGGGGKGVGGGGRGI